MEKSDFYRVITNVKLGYQILDALYSDEGGAIVRCLAEGTVVLICVAALELVSVQKTPPASRDEYCSRAMVRYKDRMMELYNVKKELSGRKIRKNALEANDGYLYLFEEIDEKALAVHGTGVTPWDSNRSGEQTESKQRRENQEGSAAGKTRKILGILAVVLLSAAALTCAVGFLIPRWFAGNFFKDRIVSLDTERILPEDPVPPEADAEKTVEAPKNAADVDEDRTKEVRVLGIKVKDMPKKTTQYVGDQPSTIGLRIALLYTDQSEEIVDDGFTVAPAHLETAGNQEITVRYGDYTAAYSITVLEVKVDSVTIRSLPTKTTYYIGEAFQSKGLELNARYNNGEIKTVSKGFVCTPENLTTAGEQSVMVSYEGASTSCKVTVYGASRILKDNNQTGKTESDAKRALGKYNVNLSTEYESADGAHTGKVLYCEATSEQSITLVVGKQTDFSVKEKNGSITITGIAKATDFLDIPDRINGLTVTEIADYAFEESDSSGDTGLRKVKLPSGLVRIGEGAFSCCQYLQEANLPDSVEEIGDGAFWNCSALTSVTFGHVKTIGSFAFQYCTGLAKVEIPNTCISIGEEAFCGAWAAKTIVLPASLTSIGPGSFTGCSRAEFKAAAGSYAERYLAESGLGGD